jgi:predicted hydrocarbon binding protein
MNGTAHMGAMGVVGMPRTALHALVSALYRDHGTAAAAPLQEAGYAAGLFDVFRGWTAQRPGGAPESIPAERFEADASAFLSSLGWGTVEVGSLGGVATVDSADWGEANPALQHGYPACYFTAGMLADFFGRLAEVPVAALEVECRSAGSHRCRFLVGAPETIQRVYDGWAGGIGYADSLGAS